MCYPPPHTKHPLGWGLEIPDDIQLFEPKENVVGEVDFPPEE
jgi:hypothetical protein